MLTSFSVITACSSLPRGAALNSEILNERFTTDAQINIRKVNAALLDEASSTVSNNSSIKSSWVLNEGGTFYQIIAIGDQLDITIWDGAEDPLLTPIGQKMAVIKTAEVSPEGNIFIPYLGEVNVEGLSTDQARKKIQSKFARVIPSAQAQLVWTAGRQNSVEMVSGTKSPGIYQLSDGNFTLLGLIAKAGGVNLGLSNPHVSLMRKEKIYNISLEKLYSDPRFDTVLLGGDKIIIEEDQRYFLALGASGTEAVIPFDQDRITALDAMSMIGGLSDARADPTSILILRENGSFVAVEDKQDRKAEQVIFSVDLTTAEGLFSAGQFEIFPRDLVLATESNVTDATTLLTLFGMFLGISASMAK